MYLMKFGCDRQHGFPDKEPGEPDDRGYRRDALWLGKSAR